MRISGVYSITNTRNLKRNIGSSADLKLRRRAHWYALRHNKHFNRHLQKAWNKYGEDAFIFEILFYWPAYSKESLLDMETAAIKIYRSAEQEFGYNICKIANSCLGVKHLPRSKEYRAKISKALKGKPKSAEHKMSMSISRKSCAYFSPEHRAKISAATKGEKHHSFGKHPSPEARAKMSAAHMGKGNLYAPKGEKHAKAKLTWEKVNQIRKLRTEGVSCLKIAHDFGVSRCHISSICMFRCWKCEEPSNSSKLTALMETMVIHSQENN